MRRTFVLMMLYYLIPTTGYLRIGGADRLAFLQRQTTNDIALVQPGSAVLTVLTTPAARILDVLYILPEADTLAVLTLPGRGESTRGYLQSRVFFMDKVTVADASAELAQIDLLGPDTTLVLERLELNPQIAPNQIVSGVYKGASLQVLGMEPTFGLGLRLIVPVIALDPVWSLLGQVGVTQLSDEEYSILRVEAGLPAAGAELSEDYTPLEAGLAAAISSTKGCYTGQEVLARQITYDKVTQHLCGLKLAGPTKPGKRVWSPDGSPVGKVTSATTSLRFGEIALAVLKRPHHEPGADIRVGETFETSFAGRVAELPFGNG